MDNSINELHKKIDALVGPTPKPLGDGSRNILSIGDESARPGLFRTSSDITERYNETTIAWHESIINVTGDPSLRAPPPRPSSLTSSVAEIQPPLPIRNNSVSAELHYEALVISEEKVKELIKKGKFLQAAKQQRESYEYRLRLSYMRPFSFEERVDMEEKRADLLLKCTTVSCWKEAAIILQSLLGEETLDNEARFRERQGILHLKLGYLLANPQRIGRQPDIGSAEDHVKQAVMILGALDVPPEDELVRAHRLLVPILRFKGNLIEAEAHESWMRRRGSNVSTSDVSNPSSDIPSDVGSLVPTPNTSTSGGVGGRSKAFEWCERLHLKSCLPGCQRQHYFPYTTDFRFDQPLEDGEDGLTLFHLAIQAGKQEVVQEMVAEVCMTQVDASSTALFLAAEARNAQIAEILLRYGASADAYDIAGRTALHRCQIGDNHQGVTTAETFLEACPALLDKQDKEGHTALFMAVENNHRRMTQKLLDKGADPNIRDRYGRTCLHVAVEAVGTKTSRRGRHLDIVASLLNNRGRKPADPNVRDNFDKTPLYLAADLGNLQIVEKLISARADPNGRGVLDETPLIAAVKHGHIAVAEKLVASGADSTLHDKCGKDAFAYGTGPLRNQFRRVLSRPRI